MAEAVKLTTELKTASPTELARKAAAKEAAGKEAAATDKTADEPSGGLASSINIFRLSSPNPLLFFTRSDELNH